MIKQKEWLIIDLGGSIVAPSNCDGPDEIFAQKIISFLYNWLYKNELRCLGLVVGGGVVARRYQRAALSMPGSPDVNKEALDWLGIRATHLNGEYLRLLAASLPAQQGEGLVTQALLTQYAELPPAESLGRIVVGGGWKPGFSTDYDAVLLAEHVGAKRLLCLSNIEQIYSDDPAQNPTAVPLAELDWPGYQKIIGREWVPGSSMPFDPIATTHAAKIGLELVFAAGRNLANLQKILSGQRFVGTVVR